MVRLQWQAAAVATVVGAGLTCAGLVYSQQTSSQQAIPAVAPADVVTIQEPGQAPQKFVIQSSKRAADGKTAYQMRNLATGEVSTFYMDSHADSPVPSPVPSDAKVKTNAFNQWTNGQPTNQTKQVAHDTAVAAPVKGDTQVMPMTTTSPAPMPAPMPEPTGKGSLTQWIKNKFSSQPRDMVPDQVVESNPPAGAKGSSSIFSWLKRRPNNQPDEVAQEQVIQSQPSATPKSNTSLVHWFKSKTSSQPQEVAQERVVAGPSLSEVKMQAAPAPSPPLAAQPAPSAPAQTASSPFRTIEEAGKPPLKCQVMVSWRTPEGHKASQLQAVDSGEILTIVESGPTDGTAANHGKVTATLYHWGHNTSAPAGVPTPPLPSFAKAMPSGAPVDASLAKAKDIAKAPEPAKSIDLAKTNDGTKATAAIKAPETVKTTTVAKASEVSKTKDTWKPAEADKVAESRTAAEVAKAMEMFKAPESAKAISPPKSQALPIAANTVKTPAPTPAVELPKTPVIAQTPEAPKVIEMPKVADAPKPIDTAPAAPTVEIPAVPIGVDTAKADDAAKVMPSIPTAPAEVKVPEIPPVPSAPSVGKPAVDTTLPAGVLPSIPTPLTTTSSAPTSPLPAPMPPTPTQLVTGTTTGPSALSLPPSTSMPGSQFAATAKNDPLANPESFVPARIEDKAMANTTWTKSPGVGTAQAYDNSHLPPGSASVVAAGGDPRFLPVPIVTVPQARPPMAPPPRMPEAPNPTMYVNAFTPAMPPGNPPMMAYGYGPMPMQMPMPMMPPQGYPMPMTPMMPMQPAMGHANPAMGYANSAMDRPGATNVGTMSLQQCTYMLQSSIYPTQREMAVDQLCACDWRANPHIANVLLATAKDDPAAMVRVAAVRGLVRMGIFTEQAMATYNQLKNDADPRVRQEAERAVSGRQ
jgi:hypothetical protein